MSVSPNKPLRAIKAAAELGHTSDYPVIASFAALAHRYMVIQNTDPAKEIVRIGAIPPASPTATTASKQSGTLFRTSRLTEAR